MQELVRFIASQYNLDQLRYEGLVEQGFLSQNHVLTTDNQRFFLKRYRFTTKDSNPAEKVSMIHRAIFHFAAHGIPAVLPLRATKGASFVAWGEHCYALFPFVEGMKTKRGEMAQATLESAGETVARLHQAGHNVLDISPPNSKARFNDAPFWEKSQQILEIIERKNVLTSFDELCKESLTLKRALAKENPPIFSQLGLADDHLVHGDFQNDNFFVDEGGQVNHIFDWELTKVTAREVDLLRSVLFICLQKGDDFTLTLTPETWVQAEYYLASYHDSYPVVPEKLVAAVENRRLGNIYSIWIEEEHYLLNNDRVDVFMLGSFYGLRYFGYHKEEFAERLIETLE